MMTATAADPFSQAARGQPVEGSVYFRNYCSTCRTPIRVTQAARFARNCECHRCRRLRPGRPMHTFSVTPS